MANKTIRYCIVCEREYGPGLDRHCTENSLVIMEKGVGRTKGTKYYSLDGKLLSDEEYQELKLTETKKFRQSEEQKRKYKPEIHQKSSELADVLRVLQGQDNSDSQNIKCCQCGSSQLSVNQKGFGLKKAATGAVILGPVGLLGGLVGSKTIIITCLNCGYQWEPGK